MATSSGVKPKTLRTTVENLLQNCAGLGPTGSVNVESGSFEFSEGFCRYACEACASYRGFTRECKRCGRAPGNNVSFLAGRGDGVYSSVTFYGAEGSEALAVLWIFDEDNAFSQASATALTNGLDKIDVSGDLLVPALADYLDLSGVMVGKIDASEAPLVSSDPMMTVIEDAMVTVPFSEGHSYSIALFFEPVLSSPTVQMALRLGQSPEEITGGFKQSLRPRVAIAIQSDRADELLALDPELSANHDWERQHDGWATMQVAGNIGSSNGTAVAYNNGLLWRSFLERVGMGSTAPGVVVYLVEAMGWFVQAACEGDEDAKEQVRELNAHYDGKLIDPDFLGLAVTNRGFALTEELEAFVRDVCSEQSVVELEVSSESDADLRRSSREPGSPGATALACHNCGAGLDLVAKFCPECGEAQKIVAFCPECGSKRPGEAKFCSDCGTPFL
jgi:hypothetical protein